MPVRDLNIFELEKEKEPLKPLREGRSLGLLSEAGCPAIADPGAALVEAAHREGFKVVPLVGPSSITLALMASGLEGQRFAFFTAVYSAGTTLGVDAAGSLPAQSTHNLQAQIKAARQTLDEVRRAMHLRPD